MRKVDETEESVSRNERAIILREVQNRKRKRKRRAAQAAEHSESLRPQRRTCG
jgi:hypothetical protein